MGMGGGGEVHSATIRRIYLDLYTNRKCTADQLRGALSERAGERKVSRAQAEKGGKDFQKGGRLGYENRSGQSLETGNLAAHYLCIAPCATGPRT